MALALINGRVLIGERFEDALVIIENGRIESVGGAAPAGAQTCDLDGAYLAPGFVDVQVNGGGGALFNDDPSVDTIKTIAAAHRRFGTTGLLPTLISDDSDKIAKAIAATAQAIGQGVPGVLGLHLEGPYLNPIRKGVHDAAKFRALDEDAFKLITSLKAGRTLVTLAPEQTSPHMIRRLTSAGVIVAAGHSNGGYDEVRGALEAGVSGFTHLFNAMSPLTSREPGAVGAALEDEKTWCSIIVDGRHVHPAALRIALKCKPLSRFMLVTDAMPTVGSDSETFELQGRPIVVRGGVCVAPDGALAGSNLSMIEAVRNAQSMLGVSLAQACAMASRHPASVLGLKDLGRIAPGARANLVSISEAGEVLNTWIDGDAAL